MTPTTTQQRVRAGLAEADFPAHRDDRVAAAERNGTDEDTVRALRSIPPVDYANTDGLASVTTTP